MWEESKDLGVLRPGQKVNIIFKVTDEDIKSSEINLIPSCDFCTKAYFDEANQCVVARYTVSPIPKHLTQKGIYQYQSNKRVIVKYRDKEQVLSFNAKVEDK